MEKLSIKAPFPGVLGFRTVSPGAYVTAGTPLVNLEKIDRLKVTFSVPEIYLQRLSAGQKISVRRRCAARPGVSKARSMPSIPPSTSMAVPSRSERALDNRDGKLRPGLLVRITVKGAPRDAVTIPESALVPRGNDVLVYRTDNGKALETKVLAGRRENGFVEILEGVEAGQSIVTAGQQRLRDGVRGRDRLLAARRRRKLGIMTAGSTTSQDILMLRWPRSGPRSTSRMERVCRESPSRPAPSAGTSG